jgi:hypothetical protein
LFFGNFLLALGGTCIFVPSFQVANAFPNYSGRIVALVTGAFDGSAAILLIYHVAQGFKSIFDALHILLVVHSGAGIACDRIH